VLSSGTAFCNTQTLCILLQYGGYADGIDRKEFQAMLQNLDGFSGIEDGGLPESDVRAAS
jgi:hypothetical protein